MKTNYLFLAPGFEETEAIAPLDILRRAGAQVKTVSITPGEPVVTGAHGVGVTADMTIDQLPSSAATDADWLILPGGMPGATNLVNCKPLAELLKAHAKAEGNLAAICASPAVVLGALGLLSYHRATCYPDMDGMAGDETIEWVAEGVVRDGRVITGRGPAYAFAFGMALAEAICGRDAAAQVAAGMLLS